MRHSYYFSYLLSNMFSLFHRLSVFSLSVFQLLVLVLFSAISSFISVSLISQYYFYFDNSSIIQFPQFSLYLVYSPVITQSHSPVLLSFIIFLSRLILISHYSVLGFLLPSLSSLFTQYLHFQQQQQLAGLLPINLQDDLRRW